MKVTTLALGVFIGVFIAVILFNFWVDDEEGDLDIKEVCEELHLELNECSIANQICAEDCMEVDMKYSKRKFGGMFSPDSCWCVDDEKEVKQIW